MASSKVAINRGFVLGYAAIAILALLAGFVSNYSANLAVDADTLGEGSSCLTYTTVQRLEPTAEEKEVFGSNAVAYSVLTRQNKRLKVLLGAKEQSRVGGGGIVAFTAGIQNLNDYNYTDKKGRVVLKYTDVNTEKRLDFYYGNPNLALGKYWYKTVSTSMNNYNSALQLELRNGSNYHFQSCIANAINLPAALAVSTPTPTPTVTATSTTTSTTTSTWTVTSTATTTTTTTSTASPYTFTIKNGYNAIMVGGGYSISPFTNAGMVVFDYNRNGDKKWRSTARGDKIGMVRPGLGYYVYNPGPERTINLGDVPMDDQTLAVVKKGWNLLGTKDGGKLSQINVHVLNPGQANACNTLACARATNLKALFEGTPSTRKAYGKIYKVADGNASNAATAFSVIEITADNIDKVEIPSGSMYWVYLFEL